MTHPFSILKEDLIAKDKDGEYSFSPENCPFQQAFVRQFPEFGNNITVGRLYVFSNHFGPSVASLGSPFTYDNFEELQRGIEFHTTIEFI